MGSSQDEHLRLHRHHPRNRGATLFTAGEVKGRFFEILLLEPYELRGAAHTLIDFPLAQTHIFWAKGDVRINRGFKKLIFRILEAEAHAKTHAPKLRLIRPDILPIKQDLPGGGWQKAVKMLDQR